MTASHSASSDLAVEGVGAGVDSPVDGDGVSTVLDGWRETGGGGVGKGGGRGRIKNGKESG